MTKKDAVIVYGAGISGRGAAQVLADRKQQVYLYNDMDCTIEPQLLQLLESVGGGLAIGQAEFESLLDIAEVLVLSPGIACDNANVLLAEQRGLEVISEVELATGCMAVILPLSPVLTAKPLPLLSWARCSNVCRCLLQ